MKNLNKQVRCLIHPVPPSANAVADLITGGTKKYFMKVDCTKGYWQMSLSEESKLLTRKTKKPKEHPGTPRNCKETTRTPINCEKLQILKNPKEPQGPLWNTLQHFVSLWTSLDMFGPIWINLDHFGPLRITLGHFGTVLAALSCSDLLCPSPLFSVHLSACVSVYNVL